MQAKIKRRKRMHMAFFLAKNTKSRHMFGQKSLFSTTQAYLQINCRCFLQTAVKCREKDSIAVREK
jgi:cytochrome c oxidase assembly protein Cox11